MQQTLLGTRLYLEYDIALTLYYVVPVSAVTWLDISAIAYLESCTVLDGALGMRLHYVLTPSTTFSSSPLSPYIFSMHFLASHF